MTIEPNVQKMEAQLKNWESRLSRLNLKDEASMAEAAPQIEYHKRISRIKAKRSAARSRLDELRAAGIGEWGSFQTGIEIAWKDLETAFKDLTR
jgi:hypothetical protein